MLIFSNSMSDSPRLRENELTGSGLGCTQYGGHGRPVLAAMLQDRGFYRPFSTAGVRNEDDLAVQGACPGRTYTVTWKR